MYGRLVGTSSRGGGRLELIFKLDAHGYFVLALDLAFMRHPSETRVLGLSELFEERYAIFPGLVDFFQNFGRAHHEGVVYGRLPGIHFELESELGDIDDGPIRGWLWFRKSRCTRVRGRRGYFHAHHMYQVRVGGVRIEGGVAVLTLRLAAKIKEAVLSENSEVVFGFGTHGA